MTWVYIKSEPNLWTVGFYSPSGKWNTDSDWGSKKEAAKRVNYLNGDKLSSFEKIKENCTHKWKYTGNGLGWECYECEKCGKEDII